MDMEPNYLRNLYYAGVAGIGGALGYLYREVRARRGLKMGRLLLSSMMAAFIGYHMIFLYEAIGLPAGVAGALNGLTALLGVEFTLFLVERWVLQKFGVKPDDTLTKALLHAGWTPPASDPYACAIMEAERKIKDSETRTTSGSS